MNCKYINEETGVKCRSPYGSTKWDGYCRTHAVRMGLAERLTRKSEGGVSAGKLKKISVSKGPDGLGLITDVPPTMAHFFRSITETFVSFDAVVVFERFKMQQVGSKDKQAEQLTFALWSMSYKEKRNPRELSEMSRLLGKSEKVLIEWSNSAWMKKLCLGIADAEFVRYRPIIDAVLAQSALTGDKASIKFFYERMKEIEARIQDSIVKEELPGFVGDEDVLTAEVGVKDQHMDVPGIQRFMGPLGGMLERHPEFRSPITEMIQ